MQGLDVIQEVNEEVVMVKGLGRGRGRIIKSAAASGALPEAPDFRCDVTGSLTHSYASLEGAEWGEIPTYENQYRGMMGDTIRTVFADRVKEGASSMTLDDVIVERGILQPPKNPSDRDSCLPITGMKSMQPVVKDVPSSMDSSESVCKTLDEIIGERRLGGRSEAIGRNDSGPEYRTEGRSATSSKRANLDPKTTSLDDIIAAKRQRLD